MEQTTTSWDLQASARKTQLNSTGDSGDSAISESYPSRETSPTSVKVKSERHDSASTEQSRDIDSPAPSNASHSTHTSPSTTPVEQDNQEGYTSTDNQESASATPQSVAAQPGRVGLPQGSFAANLPEPSLLLPSEDVEVFFNHLDRQPAPYHHSHYPGAFGSQNPIHQAYQASMSAPSAATASVSQPTYETAPTSFIHSATSPVYVPSTRAPVLTMPHQAYLHQGSSPGVGQQHPSSNPHAAAAAAAVWSPQNDASYAASSAGHQRYSAYPPNSPPVSSRNGIGAYGSSPYLSTDIAPWTSFDMGRGGAMARRSPGKQNYKIILAFRSEKPHSLMMVMHIIMYYHGYYQQNIIFCLLKKDQVVQSM